MRKLFSMAVFVTTGLCTHWASAQTAAPQNPTGVRGNVSNVQRALNSRARLLERANVQTRGQADTRANLNGINNRADVSVRANANVNVNVNAAGADNRGRGNGTLLPQAAIRQRLETTVRNDVRGRVRVELETRAREIREQRPMPERERPEQPRPEGDRPEQDRAEIIQTRAEVLSQAQLRANASPAHRLLVRRLAQIDKMRDTALANGNERQLEQADRLEQLARWQFENRFAARANNPFAEVAGESMTEGSLETKVVRHPFRPAPRPLPDNRLETPPSQDQTETGENTPTPSDSQN